MSVIKPDFTVVREFFIPQNLCSSAYKSNDGLDCWSIIRYFVRFSSMKKKYRVKIRGYRNFSKTIIFGIIAIGAIVLVNYQEATCLAKSEKIETKNDLKLILNLNKKRYKRKEKIQIEARMINLSTNQSWLLSKKLNSFLLSSPFPGISISILNSMGVDVSNPVSGSFVTSALDFNSENVANWYFEFEPGMIYGYSESINLNLPAGIYRITAEYDDYLSKNWTATQTESLKLPIAQKTKSNEIKIEIVK